MVFKALIGAGASLLGGLFGSKKQTTTSHVDYQRMVREAEAAGFNPLTALRNGGAAGFSVSTTPGAPLSARLADGVAGATQSFLANFDPFADQKRELEFSLVQAQINNLNASTSAFTSQSFNVPGRGAGQIEQRPSGQAAQLGLPQAPEAGDVTVTNPWQTAVVNPNVRDAEAFEARYGDSEIAQMLYGAYVGVSDYWSNHTAKLSREVSEIRKAKGLNEDRKARIRRDAAKNARDLGFPGY